MAKIVLTPITSGYNLSKINDNFVALVAELQDNVLYRDNPSGEPNLMNNDLDMNSNRILNLPAPVAATEVARLKDIQTMGATSLPEQTGHAGKFIQTDGEAASWQVPDASEISNTPSGEMAATTVQGAIDELDTDLQGFKATIANDVADGYVAKTAATGSAEIPTGTQAQRDATPSAGYFRFNSDTGKFEGYNGSLWGSVGGGATGGGNDEIFVENAQTVTTDYSIPVGRNAHSVGPIEVDTGVTVTVPAGSRWVIS